MTERFYRGGAGCDTPGAGPGQGNVTGELTVASTYYYGKHASQDYTKAIKRFRLAAQLGDANAQMWSDVATASGKQSRFPRSKLKKRRRWQRTIRRITSRVAIEQGSCCVNIRTGHPLTNCKWFHFLQIQKLAMFSTLSDSEVLVSKLELENSRLRNEIERLGGFIMRDEMDAAENRATADRRMRQRGTSFLPILDNLHALIGYWDINLRNRFANRAYSNWLGIIPEQLLGMHIRDVVREERYRLNLPYIEGVLRGEAQQFEHTIPTPDGNGVMYFQAEYIPNIVDGEVQGFFVQVSDITKIREVEETSSLLKFGMNQVREAFLIIDESGRFVYVNKEACVSLGYEQSELIGMSVADISPDRPAEMWPERWHYIRSQSAVTFESRHKMKNGGIFHVEINANYFEFSGKPHIFAVVRDITDKKLARNALLLQSEILNHVQEGVKITRASDGTIVYATPVFYRMFGYAENELVGKKVGFLNASTTRTPEQIADEIDQILNESGYWQGEIKNCKKDGSAFWCWVKISSFEHHEFGKVWVAVHEDITQRKQIETDLEKAKILLHRDLLVREVHHRIKNNLQGITGVLRLFATSHPELAKPLNQAISQVQSIAVIHGLQGKSGLNTVQLCEMTSAIAAGIESLWGRPISIDIPSNCLARDIVESEGVPMALILNELIANAIRHGDQNGNMTIKFRYEPSRDSVIVLICNSGSIPPGFGLNKPDLLGTGLQLIASLLPQNGARLYWDQEGGNVFTTLEVSSPVISLIHEAR